MTHIADGAAMYKVLVIDQYSHTLDEENESNKRESPLWFMHLSHIYLRYDGLSGLRAIAEAALAWPLSYEVHIAVEVSWSRINRFSQCSQKRAFGEAVTMVEEIVKADPKFIEKLKSILDAKNLK